MYTRKRLFTFVTVCKKKLQDVGAVQEKRKVVTSWPNKRKEMRLATIAIASATGGCVRNRGIRNRRTISKCSAYSIF